MSKFNSFSTSWKDTAIRGPLEFSGLDIQTLHLRKVTEHGTLRKWEKVQPGLSFTGLCHNSKCKAYLDRVSPCLVGGVVGATKGGFGTFNVAKDTCFCKCPICGEQILGEIKCYLHMCKWSYEGIVVPEDTPIRRRSTERSLQLTIPSQRRSMFHQESERSSTTQSLPRSMPTKGLQKIGNGVAASRRGFYTFTDKPVVWAYLDIVVSPLDAMVTEL